MIGRMTVLPHAAKKHEPRRAKPPLPGEVLDVSRIEHETLGDEVIANRRRFERLERQVTVLAARVAELEKLLFTKKATR